MSAVLAEHPVSSTTGSLRDYLDLLDRRGLLHRIRAEVDPVHELGAISYESLRQKGPALFFENISGYDTPLATNILSTDSMVGEAFGVHGNLHQLFDAVVDGMTHPVAPVVVESGPCKEIILRGEEADLTTFPTPTWHELDVAPYFGTFHGCITRGLSSDDQNMGMYRLGVLDKQTMSLSMHRDGFEHLREWEKAGEPMPMAVVVGMDPLLSIAAMNTIAAGIAKHAEIAVAGGWRGQPVALTRCETSDLLVPANAEIVVEGHILPHVRIVDGPHGESHGFYGTNPKGFQFKVDCITHRQRPIHQGLLCNFLEDGGKRITRSAVMWGDLKRLGAPGVVDVRFPDPGCGREICIVAADISVPGQAHHLIETVWGLNRIGTAWTIIVDADADLDDWNDIWWRIYTMVVPHRDIWITPPRMIGGHQPQAQHGFVSRVGMDATSKFKDCEFPDVNCVSQELRTRVLRRWPELGLGPAPI